MGRNLKLQISKVIPTFQSCRSKDPSDLPKNPIPSSHRPSTIKCHVSSSNPTHASRTVSPPGAFQWLEEENWLVLTKVRHVPPRQKVYDSSKKKKKKKAVVKYRNSAGSSRRFSNASPLETIEEISDSSNVSRRGYKVNRVRTRLSVSSVEEESDPARLSVFKKFLPCAVEGKVKESFAVVKKSDDPFDDFKRSMVEMILEKQMFEDEELEQLLICFLSLNSRYYHDLIVEAFTEIWEVMFRRYSIDHK